MLYVADYCKIIWPRNHPNISAQMVSYPIPNPLNVGLLPSIPPPPPMFLRSPFPLWGRKPMICWTLNLPWSPFPMHVVVHIYSIPLKSRARNCKRLKIPGIDSKESIPPAYVAWLVVQARQAGNRLLGFLKGLQIRALCWKFRTVYGGCWAP